MKIKGAFSPLAQGYQDKPEIQKINCLLKASTFVLLLVKEEHKKDHFATNRA